MIVQKVHMEFFLMRHPNNSSNLKIHLNQKNATKYFHSKHKILIFLTLTFKRESIQQQLRKQNIYIKDEDEIYNNPNLYSEDNNEF
ncbi:hypothetical protein GLOIN_2v1608797 [Rhizophagus clarus]|uniref:Uncharacterized protein n=1 Tax=Rhizophagus clarus TaxID=94130 RepID=A0A8H3L6S8_9GLOM|nr:hypothetical protein GLOIN_2v1608797 [Rhizophagus clarus]